MSDARVWQRCGVTAVETGSFRYLSIPGLRLIVLRRAVGLIVGSRSVTVFDTRDPYLPFPPDRPDAPGFHLGRYYVAFNRGREFR